MVIGRPSDLSNEQILALALDYIYFDDSTEKIAENHNVKKDSVTHYTKKAVSKGLVDKIIISEAAKRRIKSGRTKQRATFKLSNNQLSNLYKSFDKKNVHIIIQERMWADTEGELNKVFNFLELEPPKFDKEELYRVKSRYAKVNKKDRALLETLYKGHNEALYNLLDSKIPEWE